MSEEKKEITGWVAWHPEHGTEIETLSLDEGDCYYVFCRSVCGRYIDQGSPEDLYNGKFHERLRDFESLLSLALEDGWRIRPCKVVFTDEEKEG
jgi:hypothetical protein